MKIFNENLATLLAVVAFMFALTGPVVVLAATAPSLGSESAYGVVSATFTNSNTSPQTIINGSVCATTHTVPGPLTITGANDTPCASAKGTDQSAALNNVTNGLNTQSCTSLGTAVNLNSVAGHPTGVYTPGCYSTSGAGATSMHITTGTTVTLDAGGDPNAVFIFKSAGALTTEANISIVLTNGATADKVFWAPVEAVTLGANNTFVGNILDAAGISIGHFSTLLGRALAFGGTVTTDANTITVPATLHVIKAVNNTGGGTATPANFTMHVSTLHPSANVSGSPQAGTSTPGTSYSLSAGPYVVSEDADSSYSQSFSGDCDVNGFVTLSAGDNKTCTVTNIYITPGTATLHVEKVVVGGTAVPSNFMLHVKSGISDVTDSPKAGTSTPGTSYTLSAGTYTVSEDPNSSYTQLFGGDCNSSGVVSLLSGNDKTCILTNTNIPLPAPVSGGGSYYNAPLPLINVTKIPDPLALPSGSGSVIYTYTATNVGEVPMHGVWVRDNSCDPVTYVSGDTNNDSLLDMSESWVYRCTKILSKTEMNIATAHGQANGWDGYDTANATVVVGNSIIPPLVHVVKTPNIFVLPAGGGEVTYNYTVTNPGTAPLSDVSITDDKCTGLPGRVLGHPGDLNKNNLLESNESWSFTCKTSLTKTTTNIGMAIGHANGLTAVDLSPATVAVEAPGLPNTGLVGMTRSEALAAFHRSLGIGAEGKDVEALQTALENKGLLTMPQGVAKGYFGRITSAAVVKYQASVGLPKVGVFGPLTRAKLISEFSD